MQTVADLTFTPREQYLNYTCMYTLLARQKDGQAWYQSAVKRVNHAASYTMAKVQTK